MNMHSASHPAEQTLRDFGNGRLDDRESEAVNQHVESCAECQRRVAELSPDSFLGRLREANAPGQAAAAERSAPAQAPVATLPPELADHADYHVVRELGRGGMRVVYLAHNRLLGRDEVFKVVSRHMLERPGVADRFLREMRAAAKLHHPNIVTAYSAFHAGPSLVFAMEYVEGLDLARLVQAKGALPVAHACHFVHQAALGLQHAHEQGMVHRDIKPGNLMLARAGGRAVVKVLDFGLAKATREVPVDGGLTREGQMLGTPDYIAPEQIRDAQSADIRADIYSLGCTLYFLLSGKPPFQAISLYDLLQAHFSMVAAPLNLLRPEVPVELAALVAKMMAKEPDRRPQTPAEVAKMLTPFFRPAPRSGVVLPPGTEPAQPRTEPERPAPLAERCETAPSPDPPRTLPATPLPETRTKASDGARPPRRRPGLAAAGAAALALLGVIVVVIEFGGKKTKVSVSIAPTVPATTAVAPAHDEALAWDRPPWLETPLRRDPEPEKTARKATEQALIEEMAKREGTSKPDRTALATELVDEALKPVIFPEQRHARLMMAARLAAEGGDFVLAMNTCDALAHWFDVDGIRFKAELLDRTARFADSAEKQDALACASLATGFEALAADDYRFADSLVALARRAAEKSGVGALEDQATLLAEDMARGKAGFAAVRPYLATLRSRPDDPAANSAAGRYLCLARGDFARGLPILARGGDESLRTLAAAELKAPAQAQDARTDVIALGDRWWQLGEGKDLPRDRCRLRARQWYLKALAAGGTPLDAATSARVRGCLRAVPARTFRVRVRAQYLDIHTLRIDGDGLRLTYDYGARPKFALNHLVWDTEKNKSLPSIGATRLIPEDVDYGSIEILEYKQTGGSWANYGHFLDSAYEDHDTIAFKHWPSGNFNARLTLVFGRRTATKDWAVAPEWQAKFFTWSKAAAQDNPGYWDNLFQTEPIKTATLHHLFFDDANKPFVRGVPGDFFATEMAADVELPAGDLEVTVYTDDGIAFFVDEVKILSEWGAGGHWRKVFVPVAAGKHRLRLRYQQYDRDARLLVSLRIR